MLSLDLAISASEDLRVVRCHYRCACPSGDSKIQIVQEYRVINISELQAFADKYNVSDIDVSVLLEKKYVRKQDKIKILGNGELKSKLKVVAHAHSAKAKEIIEAQGGSIDLI